MKILEKLKTLFESKFEHLFSNNTIKLFDFSRNTQHVLEVRETEEGKKFAIDVSKATEEEKKSIKEIIDFAIQDEGEPFLTKKDKKKTEQLKRNLPKEGDDGLLRFYKDKLPVDIYRALEMSLIVRNAFAKGEDILELKRDIAFKFPEYGNNVCNLTTSDYFDGYFKELYSTMFEEEGFDIIRYQEEVGWIIRALPYMVFVNRYKSLEEFSGEVKFKLSKLRKYGTNKLKLHAIGKDNVDKSLIIAEEYKGQTDIIIEKEINKNRTIATIVFRF